MPLTFESSHSHRMSGSQPCFRRERIARLSRSRVAANFPLQNSAFDFGMYANRHARCRCQKHPCTKMTFLLLGKAKSGVPGKSRRWSRNRYPRACASLRTASSGFVSLPRMRDIAADRCTFVMTSISGHATTSTTAALCRHVRECRHAPLGTAMSFAG